MSARLTRLPPTSRDTVPLLVRSTLLTVESCSAVGLRSVSPRVALTLIVYLPSTAWAPLQIRWQGGLTKELHVFNFSDCELVYYTASTDDKSVTCVEFEALATEDIPAALATLSM